MSLLSLGSLWRPQTSLAAYSNMPCTPLFCCPTEVFYCRAFRARHWTFSFRLLSCRSTSSSLERQEHFKSYECRMNRAASGNEVLLMMLVVLKKTLRGRSAESFMKRHWVS